MESRFNTHISVLVPCEFDSRDAVGSLIQHICSRLEEQGESKQFGYQVLSAFNEAFNNLARHGDRLTTNQITIILEVTDNRLLIEIHDDGEPFEFNAKMEQPKPEPEELPETGMGLFIMNSFMSELKYDSNGEEGGNVLRMVRNLILPDHT